jgi:hypothetical protein
MSAVVLVTYVMYLTNLCSYTDVQPVLSFT